MTKKLTKLFVLTKNSANAMPCSHDNDLVCDCVSLLDGPDHVKGDDGSRNFAIIFIFCNGV